MTGVFAIDGVQIPAGVLRNVAYDGNEGIRGPGELKVSALTVPGGSVTVAPGAGVAINRYPGGNLQAYSFFETSSLTVPVPATGSSAARNDLLIARIYDAEFQSIPAGKTRGASFELIQGVSAQVIANAAAAHAYTKTLGYPAIPLAAIMLPANTGTVQASHIRDLRSLANPRWATETLIKQIDVDQNLTSGTFVRLGGYGPTVTVPTWANAASIKTTISCVYEDGGQSQGHIKVDFGGKETPALVWDTVNTANDAIDRTIFVAGAWDITNLQGKNVEIWTLGARSAGQGHLALRNGRTFIVHEIHFREKVA